MVTRLMVVTVISFCSVLTHMACPRVMAVKQVYCCYYRTCSFVVFVSFLDRSFSDIHSFLDVSFLLCIVVHCYIMVMSVS